MNRFHLKLAQRISGFSLVELLVAGVIMVISSVAATFLFNQATRQATFISKSFEYQFAISNQLAVILDHNDRYTCSTINCSVQTAGNPPNQNQYVPANPDDPTHSPTFRQLCAVGLADNLISHINSIPKITGNEITLHASTDLSSSVSPSSLPPHRYLVRWSTTDGRILRQVQLVPTVAAWCP